LRSMVSAHRIDGDFRHIYGKNRLAFFNLNNGAAAVKAAMRASAVRQHGFTTFRTGAPLRFGQAVVGAALIFYPLRGPSLGYRHRFNPIFLRVLAATNLYTLNFWLNDRL
jgi:hypothetical protein